VYRVKYVASEQIADLLLNVSLFSIKMYAVVSFLNLSILSASAEDIQVKRHKYDT
jgi:hypothetical protein